MLIFPLETALWIGALTAAGEVELAHLDGELGELVAQLLALERPAAQA